jgi:WD40 repeat protein
MNISTPIQHGHDTTSLAIAPDNTLLVTATSTGDVYVHCLPDGTTLRRLEPHPAPVWDIAFSPDMTFLALCSSDSDSPAGTVQLWHIPSWTHIQTLADDETGGGHSLAFTPDTTFLLVGHADGQTRLWRIADATVQHMFADTSEIPRVATSRLNPVAAIANDESIRIWQLSDMRLLQTFTAQTDWVYDISLSPDARYLAASNTWGPCEVWTTSGESVCRIPAASFSHIGLSANGQVLACGGDDGQIHLHQIRDGSLLMTATTNEKRFRTLQFMPDGTMLISGGHSGAVRFWQIADT